MENQQYNQIEEWILVVIAAFSSVLIALLLWTASMIFKDLAAEFMPFSDLTVNRLRRIARDIACLFASTANYVFCFTYSTHTGL